MSDERYAPPATDLALAHERALPRIAKLVVAINVFFAVRPVLGFAVAVYAVPSARTFDVVLDRAPWILLVSALHAAVVVQLVRRKRSALVPCALVTAYDSWRLSTSTLDLANPSDRFLLGALAFGTALSLACLLYVIRLWRRRILA